jgi:hypothetical protein
MQNWKTTVAGLLTALIMAAANYSGPNTWQGYLACLGPIALGVLAKDFDTHSTQTQVSVATKQANDASIAAINAIK